MKTLTAAPYRAKRDCQPHRGNSTVPCFQQLDIACSHRPVEELQAVNGAEAILNGCELSVNCTEYHE